MCPGTPSPDIDKVWKGSHSSRSEGAMIIVDDHTGIKNISTDCKNSSNLKKLILFFFFF